MEKKIAFLCPYFGKLDVEQYKLWLKSCEANNSIDFFIITNDDKQIICDLSQ